MLPHRLKKIILSFWASVLEITQQQSVGAAHFLRVDPCKCSVTKYSVRYSICIINTWLVNSNQMYNMPFN